MPATATAVDCGHPAPYGICPRCRRAHGYRIHLHQPQPPTPHPMSHHLTRAAELTALAGRAKEARRNLDHWTRQRDLRTEPKAKAEAAARVRLWTSTLAAIEADISARS